MSTAAAAPATAAADASQAAPTKRPTPAPVAPAPAAPPEPKKPPPPPPPNGGLRRGKWTPEEEAYALRLIADNWEVYEKRLYDAPVLTKSLINMVIYTVAEWLSQVLRAAKDYVDHCVGEECDVAGGDGERQVVARPSAY